MCEKLLGHEVVRLLDAGIVVAVDSESDTHEHVLGRFTHVQIATLERLDPKVTKRVVTLMINP